LTPADDFVGVGADHRAATLGGRRPGAAVTPVNAAPGHHGSGPMSADPLISIEIKQALLGAVLLDSRVLDIVDGRPAGHLPKGRPDVRCEVRPQPKMILASHPSPNWKSRTVPIRSRWPPRSFRPRGTIRSDSKRFGPVLHGLHARKAQGLHLFGWRPAAVAQFIAASESECFTAGLISSPGQKSAARQLAAARARPTLHERCADCKSQPCCGGFRAQIRQ
jgi:hypothetical protein